MGRLAVLIEIGMMGVWMVWFIAFLNSSRRQAREEVQRWISPSAPRPALARYVPPPPPPALGSWEYALPPKRLTQKPWFIP